MMTDEPTEFDPLAPQPQAPPEKCTKKHSLVEAVSALSEDSLYWLDAVFSSLVVSPLMVGFWRGTWMIIDNHGEYFPYISSFIISSVLEVSSALLRPIFAEYFAASKYYRALRACYTYVCAVLGILQWRCYWIIVDQMFAIVYNEGGAMISVNIRPVLICCGVSLLLLFWMKGIINVIGSPFTVSLDDIEPFQFPTRFKIDLLYVMSETSRLFTNPKDKLIEIGATYYFTDESDIKAKTKYTFITSLDTFLSVCVITPLVITNWRGIWVLYDLYGDFFPPVESYIFASCILICWTFIRDILQDSFEKYQKRFGKAYIWKCLIQVYIFHFNIMVNMKWRGAFMIFDLVLGIELTEFGAASCDNCIWPTISATLLCMLALTLLRSLRNAMAVPFILALDNPAGIFHFPTRFRMQVLYLIILLKSNSHPIATNAANNTDLANAESLMSTATKIPPRPFINNFRGPPPASFHPTRPRPTEMVYPQLQSYNHAMHQSAPHNIQDIIGFIHAVPRDRKQAQGSMKHYVNTNSHDPFYSYKPKDPSDINLLATANLRFAPPAWKDLKSNPLVPSSSALKPHEMQYEQQQHYHNAKNTKALTLSLNVFPMANDPYKENFYAVSGGAPNINMMMSGARNRKAFKPRKMIIHLNVYQNDLLNREDAADEDYEIERSLIEKNMDGLQEMLNNNNNNNRNNKNH